MASARPTDRRRVPVILRVLEGGLTPMFLMRYMLIDARYYAATALRWLADKLSRPVPSVVDAPMLLLLREAALRCANGESYVLKSPSCRVLATALRYPDEVAYYNAVNAAEVALEEVTCLIPSPRRTAPNGQRNWLS